MGHSRLACVGIASSGRARLSALSVPELPPRHAYSRPSVAILLVLGVGAFATGTDAVVIAGILPQISGSFGVSAGVAGLLVPAFAATYAVVSPILASAGEVDRRWSMLAGMAAFVVANAAAALAAVFSV